VPQAFRALVLEPDLEPFDERGRILRNHRVSLRLRQSPKSASHAYRIGYVRLAWWDRLMHWLYYVGAAVAVVILLNVVLVLYLAIAGRDAE
jgi:hypothetical protein